MTETAKAAEFFLADGLILTGIATGCSANATELSQVKKCSSLPVLIGSGVTCDNLEDYLEADAVIVGSHFKKDGKWNENVKEERVKIFIEKKKSLISS